jgi:hypothetical protein
MTNEIQNVVVLAAVALAAAFVVWTVIARFWSRGKNCGSACSGCGASDKSLGESKPFVGIDTLSQSSKRN